MEVMEKKNNVVIASTQVLDPERNRASFSSYNNYSYNLSSFYDLTFSLLIFNLELILCK
jgi:hypothetical protein